MRTPIAGFLMPMSLVSIITVAADAQIPALQTRVPVQGIRVGQGPEGSVQTDVNAPFQQPNDKMEWYLDARFGMFIHWGLYAGPAQGEWYMNNDAVPIATYERLATNTADPNYFAADKYDPAQWAQLAKDAGQKWMTLTSRHHEGFCLFDSPYPTAFTSMQTHKRDFFGEYATACRNAGLRVGLYYSIFSWRHPGYFDIYGTGCQDNPWGYTTDAAYREDARVMKEESYVNMRTLMTKYGRIDHIFYDGHDWGYNNEFSPFFYEPCVLDPTNQWQISAQYQESDPATGKKLGLVGVVRKYMPDVIQGPRCSWVGDVLPDEGPTNISGSVGSSAIHEKCVMSNCNWGYQVCTDLTRDQVVRFLADCVIRNWTLLLNVGPDRHGVIPQDIQTLFLQVGDWVGKASASFYGTRGGPWDPTDGKYGYCFRDNTIFVHLLSGYSGTTFKLPSIGSKRAVRAWNVLDGSACTFTQNADNTVTVSGINRSLNAADAPIGVELNEKVYTSNPWSYADDKDASIAYGAGWTESSNAMYYRGSCHTSTTAGSSASFAFNGTDVVFNGYLGPDAGIAEICLDGTLKFTMDCYSANKQYYAPVYDFRGLTVGQHTLTIKALGTKNAKSTGTQVIIDGFACKGAVTAVRAPAAIAVKAGPRSAVIAVAGGVCALPRLAGARERAVSIFDPSGAMVKRMIIDNSVMNLRTGLGLAGKLYVVRVEARP